MSEGSTRVKPFSGTRVAGLVVGIVAALHAAYYFPRCVDDLFISLRFAENFAHGRGIVFNPGERVEGYSSPLWMLLQAVGFVFRFEGVTWTKLLGLASLGALLVGVQRFARDLLDVEPLTAQLGPLLIALASHVVAWSVLGLETPAFLALLVWFPIVLRRHLDAPSRRSSWIAGAVAVALVCARPEAPLYLGAMGLAELGAQRPTDARIRLGHGVRLAVPVIAAVLVLLVARRLYFGLWLPHTYYVKGSTSGFELAKLGPLVREGVGSAEEAFYLGGIVLAVAIAAMRRAPSVLAAIACSLFFTASVERDWMPSLRHLLPVVVFAAIAWVWLVDRVGRWSLLGDWSLYAAAALVLVLASIGLQIAKIDVRFSLIDKGLGNKPWVTKKSTQNMQDAWMSLHGLEPLHVDRLGTFEMGLITQNYRVLEAAAAPLEDSWFIGRDIGQVGFYTNVRVFDTPGLFTPDVVTSAASGRDRAIDGALVRKAFAHKPVSAEILDAWTPALAAEQGLLVGYDLAVGTPSWPIDLMQSDRPLPSPDEVLRRYEASLAKFPQWFCLATLYGESSGGAMRKRVRIVREIVAAQKQAKAAPLDKEQGAGATLEGAMESLGCALTPQAVHAGESVRVTCAWRAVAKPSQTWWAFLHFEDAKRAIAFQEDHPEGPFHPTRDWLPGEEVLDVALLRVPPGVAPGTYRLYFGMWKGDIRPAVTPPSMSDGKDRVPGPSLVVVP